MAIFFLFNAFSDSDKLVFCTITLEPRYFQDRLSICKFIFYFPFPKGFKKATTLFLSLIKRWNMSLTLKSFVEGACGLFENVGNLFGMDQKLLSRSSLSYKKLQRRKFEFVKSLILCSLRAAERDFIRIDGCVLKRPICYDNFLTKDGDNLAEST